MIGSIKSLQQQTTMLSRRLCQQASSSSVWLLCCRANLFGVQASTSSFSACTSLAAFSIKTATRRKNVQLVFRKEIHFQNDAQDLSSTTEEMTENAQHDTSELANPSMKPPAKPIKPTIRFMKEYLGSKWEHISSGKEEDLQEAATQAAHAWNTLTGREKQKYIDAYNTENSDYKKKLEAWKRNTGAKHPAALQDKKRQLAISFEKPQPPVPAYAAFRRDFTAMNPDENGLEAAQHAWQSLSDEKRQEYIGKWKMEMDVYKADMLTWRKKMADEGRQDVLQFFNDRRFRATPAEKTKHQILLDLGKPIHPLSPYHSYVSKCVKKPAGQEDTVKAWLALDDVEKQKYQDQYEAEMLEYKMKLLDWEAYMVVKGRSDLVDVNKLKKMQLALSLAYFHREFAATKSNINGEKAIQNAWESLSEEKKQEYEELWKADNAVRRTEVLAWHKKMIAESRKSARTQNLHDGTRKAKNKIHQGLGKPKLPPPPNISFMKKLGNSPAEMKEAGKTWTELADSEKQKYYDQYRKDIAAYRKKVVEWKADMVAERPTDVVDSKEYKKLVLKESGQPKKPPSPNIMFCLDYWAKHGKPAGSVPEIVKVPTAQWKLLPEEEKQKYSDRYKAEMVEYKMKLLDWKADMIAKGRTDIVDPEEYKQLVLKMSGQPKPPLAAHLMFYREYGAKHNKLIGNAADLVKAASAQWRSLSEEEKLKYYNRHAEEWEVYEKNLREWEKKMNALSLETDENG